jgi:8-oxo-dGTP pyrophosphatase MutT (NUDIX family)
MLSLRKLRIGGYDKVILLSQYIGDFHPDAHVKGSLGSNFIALICKSNFAVAFAVSLFKIMLQMYKVFMNDKPIIITDSSEKLNNCEVYNFDEISFKELQNKINFTDTSGVCLLSKNIEKDWLSFTGNFNVIEAAGGKVINASQEVLFIYRFDKWDLPKGHVEKGEHKKVAAIREVEEECGIEGLIIEEELETTYHSFFYKEQLRLKVTYWYLMTTNYSGVLLPQQEEGITQVVFKDEKMVHKALGNTYPNIKLLF